MPFEFEEETEWKKKTVLKEGKVITRAMPRYDMFNELAEKDEAWEEEEGRKRKQKVW